MTPGLASRPKVLTRRQRIIKRLFDVTVSAVVLAAFGWIIPVAALLIRLDGDGPGIYKQVRIGKDGNRFTMLKLRTMHSSSASETTVTTSNDPRITGLGRILRRTKLDELPQFANVLKGDMSLVGPRPDVPGFADLLEGEERIILSVRPGVTGPATLAFRHEELLLGNQTDPERFNREVLFPAKVKMNLQYLHNWRFRDDIRYLWLTVTGSKHYPLGYLDE
jgi:lipopolysaccharide/colanic/teichoic acid biosynthesis glycosyltransferase